MLRCLFTLLLLGVQFVHAQPVSKVLVIDTLISSQQVFEVDVCKVLTQEQLNNFDFLDTVNHVNIVDLPDRLLILERNKIAVAGVGISMPLLFLDTASLMMLPLDDSGGMLKISGGWSYPADTIRISRYVVWHNCLSDTVRIGRWWYRCNVDTVGGLKMLRGKDKISGVRKQGCEITNIVPYTISVSGKNYTVAPVSKIGNEYATWYHGQRKMGRRAERRYITRVAENKPYEYWAGRVLVTKYGYYACLTLE